MKSLPRRRIRKTLRSQNPSQEHINQLRNLYTKGQLLAVADLAQSLTEQYPNSVIIWNFLGIAAAQIGRLHDAKNALERVTQLNPNLAEGHNNFGNFLKEQGDLEKAAKAYNMALSIKPDYAEAFYNMGNTLKAQGKLTEAVQAYNKAVSIKPDYVVAYNNMGLTLHEEGKLEKALAAYNAALNFQPDYAESLNNMGNTLTARGELEKAMQAYNKALSIKPNNATTYNDMGLALKDQGKLEQAIQAYKKALAIKPDYAEAHFNLSQIYLRKTSFKKGFKLNEWRWKTPQHIGAKLFSSKPKWNGQSDKRILIYSEQGIGDVIMFASIIPDLQKISTKVIISCDERLIPLFERSFSHHVIYKVSGETVDEDEYDYHISIGSLPKILRPNLSSFQKASFGYLNGDNEKTTALKKRLLKGNKNKLVGVNWLSQSIVVNAQERNISLEQLACHLNESKTQFVSLQYGHVSEEIYKLKQDHGIDVIEVADIDNRINIYGLACLILACDQIFSIDNAAAHLAGALGAKTKLLLPFRHDWRWGDEQTDCYWYGAIKIYKQKQFGDWSDVLNRLPSQ
tara:strand:- start:183 stop:1889 length:1707 start_codon:yes stop_codon:yes gene_type:complete